MGYLSNRLGEWQASHSPKGAHYGAVVCSKSWAGQRRCSDGDIMAYGGPYLLGESVTPAAAKFIAAIPLAVSVMEEAARRPCACCPALGSPCASCLARNAVNGLREHLPAEPSVVDTADVP